MDGNDQSRSLIIDANRPRGGALEPPKSGRAREVALSRRLRRALSAHNRQTFQPGPDALVLHIEPSNFYKFEWRRAMKRARLEHRPLKDLRDTFASHLLSAGVQLGYVSSELGHADVSVTAKHYARWIGGSRYREPMTLRPGEVPADFIARISDGPERPITSQKNESVGIGLVSGWNYAGLETAGEPTLRKRT